MLDAGSARPPNLTQRREGAKTQSRLIRYNGQDAPLSIRGRGSGRVSFTGYPNDPMNDPEVIMSRPAAAAATVPDEIRLHRFGPGAFLRHGAEKMTRELPTTWNV